MYFYREAFIIITVRIIFRKREQIKFDVDMLNAVAREKRKKHVIF